MAGDQPQEQPGSSGGLRRSSRKRPASAGAAGTGGTPLRSPTLAAFFSASAQQPRKQARTQPPTLRQIRKKGGGVPATLSGYLGLLPDEVSAGRRRRRPTAAHAPQIAWGRPHTARPLC